MAIQYPCEVCSEYVPEATLILIEYNGKLMCSICINDLIRQLGEIIGDLTVEIELMGG